MNGKMFALIVVSYTIGLASATQSLDALASNRVPFMVDIEKAHPGQFLAGLAQEINGALLNDPSNTDNQLWLSYVLDQTKQHPFLDGYKGQATTLEKILEEQGIQLVENGLPAINSERFKKDHASLCTQNGYEKQIQPTIGHFKEKVISYSAANYLGQVRAASVGQTTPNPDINFEALISAFSEPLVKRISEYVDNCYKPDSAKLPNQPENNSKTDTAILIGNRKAEFGKSLPIAIIEELNKFLKTSFKKLNTIRYFLLNSFTMLNPEINYLTALATTDSTKVEEVQKRAEIFGKLVVLFSQGALKINDKNKGPVTLDNHYVASIWGQNYRDVIDNLDRSNKFSDDKQKVASQIFAILMKKLSESKNAAAAKEMLDKIYPCLILRCVLLSSDAILKAKIDERPFATKATDLSVETLRSWDHILEGSSTDEAFLKWFAGISSHYHEILAVPTDKLMALNAVRRIFRHILLPQTETEVWKALYQAITKFIATGNDFAIQAIGKNFDTFLNKHYAGHPLFVIMKLMNLNHLSDGRFPIVFTGVSEETLEYTAKLMDDKKETYKYLNQGFTAAYQNLGLYDPMKGTPATLQLLKAVIAKLKEKEVFAEELKHLAKGKPFELIV